MIRSLLALLLVSTLALLAVMGMQERHTELDLSSSGNGGDSARAQLQSPRHLGATAHVSAEPTGESERVSALAREASELVDASDLESLLRAKVSIEQRFKMNPELMKSVPTYISENALPKRAAYALIHAVGMVGGATADSVLSDVALGPGFEKGQRLQAIVTIAEDTAPSTRALETLWSLARRGDVETDEVANAATLNLGVLASNVDASDQGTVDAIVDNLLNEFEAAERDHDASARILLEALANSGSRKVVPIADRYLVSSSPEMRGQGAFILRRIPGPDVEARLVRILREDPDDRVRGSAAEALSYRPGDAESVRAVGELANQEQDDKMRSMMIRYIGQRVERDPSAQAVLEELLTRENNAENYELAVEMLHTVHSFD